MPAGTQKNELEVTKTSNITLQAAKYKAIRGYKKVKKGRLLDQKQVKRKPSEAEKRAARDLRRMRNGAKRRKKTRKIAIQNL